MQLDDNNGKPETVRQPLKKEPKKKPKTKNWDQPFDDQPNETYDDRDQID